LSPEPLHIWSRLPIVSTLNPILAMSSYNRQIKDFTTSSAQRLYYPPLVYHLVSRPQSVVRWTRVALQNLYNAWDWHGSLETDKITPRSRTAILLSRSKVIPITPFRRLFISWESNDRHSVRKLPLKAITDTTGPDSYAKLSRHKFRIERGTIPNLGN